MYKTGPEILFKWKTNSRNLNVLKKFTNPGNRDAIVLKQLNQQFSFVQHFNFLYSLSLLYWEAVVDLTHIPGTCTAPSTLYEPENEVESRETREITAQTLKFACRVTDTTPLLPNYNLSRANCSTSPHQSDHSCSLARSLQMQRNWSLLTTIWGDCCS